MGPETKIKKQVLNYLNSIPGCLAKSRFTGAMGVKGEPDITGCLNGRRLEIEVKSGRNVPTDLQLCRLFEWQRVGALSACVWNVDEMKEILKIYQDMALLDVFDYPKDEHWRLNN